MLLSVLVPCGLCVAGVFFLILLAFSLKHKIIALFDRGDTHAVNFGGDANIEEEL